MATSKKAQGGAGGATKEQPTAKAKQEVKAPRRPVEAREQPAASASGAIDPAGNPSVLEASAEEFSAAVEAFTTTVRAAWQGLPRAIRMTTSDREHTTGKLRDGEPAVMGSILDAVDKHPHHFQALAKRDHGKDPHKVETSPARDALAKRSIALRLSEFLNDLGQAAGDTVLSLGERARDVTQPAYKIGVANADFDEHLASDLAQARSYFASLGGSASPTKKPTE